jgi:hypothetical protein
LVCKDLQERNTSAQNRNTAAQAGAYPDTTPIVAATDTAQSGAFSTHDAAKPCVRSVQPACTEKNPVADLPSDLAGVVAAWPSLPAHIKAAVLALVGTAKA